MHTSFRTRRTASLLSQLAFAAMVAVVAVVAATETSAVAAGPAPIRATITQNDVEAAIEAISTELLRRYDESRGWEPATWSSRHGSKTQIGGYTALVAFALIEAGRSYQEPVIRDAIEQIRVSEARGIYTLAVRICLWSRLPDRFERDLRRDLEHLTARFDHDAAAWAYDVSKHKSGRNDHSIRQFALLAMRDAERRLPGAKESLDPIWSRLAEVFLSTQLADGGWNYRADQAPARGSMTAAAVASLAIVRSRLARSTMKATRLIEINALLDAANARGMEWLDRNFSANTHPGHPGWFSYYAYAVERAGMATGTTRLGGTDWFRGLAQHTIKRLRSGSSPDPDRPFLMTTARTNAKTADLAFALLLLSRGRDPVLIGQVIGDAEDGLGHDCSWAINLAQLMSQRTESRVAWRQLSSRDPVSDWLATPLIIVSADAPPPSSRDNGDWLWPKLIASAEGGSTILVIDSGRKRAFSRWFESQALERFPGAQWRQLPPDHWARTHHRVIKGERSSLRGLTRGEKWDARDVVILAPAHFDHRDLPETRRNRRPNSKRDLVFNIALGVTMEGAPRPRLAPSDPAWRQTGLPPGDGLTRTIAILHPGKDVPAGGHEPGVWTALQSWLSSIGVEASVEFHRWNSLNECVHAHLIIIPVHPDAMTSAMQLAAEDLARKRGSTQSILITGARSRDRSPEGESDGPWDTEPIHASLAGQLLRERLGPVRRTPASYRDTGVLDQTPGLLRVNLHADVAAPIILAREDILHALLGRPHPAIAGYDTESARRLVRLLLRLPEDFPEPDADSDSGASESDATESPTSIDGGSESATESSPPSTPDASRKAARN